MESLFAWREFKARVKNRELSEETRMAPQSTKNSLMDLPMPQRAVVISRIRFIDLRNRLNSAKSAESAENVKFEISFWFAHLKDLMRDYRISKESLADCGLCWDDCKKLAYGA